MSQSEGMMTVVKLKVENEFFSRCPADQKVNALVSRRYDPGSISGIDMIYGEMVCG